VDDLSVDRGRHRAQGARAGDPRNSEFFIANWGPLGGGWGAKRTEDGVSATVCMNDGDTHNSPIEQAEAKYPVLVEHYRLAQDSGGAGPPRWARCSQLSLVISAARLARTS
jgi:N-methylhydantoinase B/oxoprolinase/acetone carboxylase alpha subunit